MGSEQKEKPHAVCIPIPALGHINPMLKLAKILHSKGFDITFVNTEINHKRLLRSHGFDSLSSIPSFRFETIPDGFPVPQDENIHSPPDIVSLIKSVNETCLGPFKGLIAKVGASYSPVTCIVSDFLLGFPIDAATELCIPNILFWTSGAGALVCCNQFPNLIRKGLIPLKDSSYLTNGYMDTVVDIIPTLPGIRLKDIPTFARMINPGDQYMVEYACGQIERAKTTSGIVVNTFQELEYNILDTLSSTCYGIGPLHLQEKLIVNRSLESIKLDFWKAEPECIKWLDAKEPFSVIYVNFGSITMMTPQQVTEFCWGLAKSNCPFLWIIRPDLVIGDSVGLPSEFLAETSDRGFLASWCSQELVLNHPSIGGFLTHNGWNSTIESISSGVPMICWPVFADQQTNCWLSVNKWSIAVETLNDVKSAEVAKQVIELMNGDKGNEMRKNAIDLKKKAEKACVSPLGSSMANLEKVINLLKASPSNS